MTRLQHTAASGVVLMLGLMAPSPARAESGCPAPALIASRMQALHLERAAHTERYDTPPPRELYDKAARHVGRAYTNRQGNKGYGVIVAELPLATLWKALNDEEQHDSEDSRIPVKHSEVIGGTPRGQSRVVFQYAQQMGIGRWWVSRVWMNRELYERSEGQLWEILWKDKMGEVDPSRPPLDTISSKLTPIKASRGAWLLASVGEGCTLVEYFNWSDPGGVIGVMQPLIIGRALRSTVNGIVHLAQSYDPAPPPGASFRRPDGTTLE